MKPKISIRKTLLESLQDFVSRSIELRKYFITFLGNLLENKDQEPNLEEFCRENNCSEIDFDKFYLMSIQLYINLDSWKKDIDRFYKEIIISSLNRNKLKNFSEESAKIVIEFLKEIYSLDNSIGILSKADYLSNTIGNYVIKSKSITDVIPIFYRDLDRPSDHAIIRHIIKIRYVKDSHGIIETELSFSMESMRELRDVIDRALHKEKTLQLDYNNKGIMIVKEFR
jgi:hypothetical protein